MKKTILVTRIVLGILFIFSAVSKLYPTPCDGLVLFEENQLYPLGIIDLAPYFSRFLIAFELILGMGFIIPFMKLKWHYLISFSLLGVFSIYLLVQAISGVQDNCGCFGELVSMTPLESLIKNILMLGAIAFLYYKDEGSIRTNNLFVPLSLFLGLILCLTFCCPQCVIQQTKSELKARSIYGEIDPIFDYGNNLICFFDPNCGHCMDVCKKLESHVKKNKPEYEVYIVFKGKENMIDGFIQETGTTFPYKVISTSDFRKYSKKNDRLKLPSLVFLNNGKVNEIWKEGKSGFPDFSNFD